MPCSTHTGRGIHPMDYDDPSCAYCPADVRACRVGEAERQRPGVLSLQGGP